MDTSGGEKTFQMALLFDFYGELLTERQHVCFDCYYNDDLSLMEIAEAQGITRQAVRDHIVRAENTLTDIECKTGLVLRFREINETVAGMERELWELISLVDGRALELASHLRGHLDTLRGGGG